MKIVDISEYTNIKVVDFSELPLKVSFKEVFDKNVHLYGFEHGHLLKKRNKIFMNYNRACHGGLKGNPDHAFYITCLGGDKLQQKNYWEDICGPDSPWFGVADEFTIIKSNDRYCAVEFPLRDDLSSQLMANFCIATRIALEHPNILETYSVLRSAGVGVADSLWGSKKFSWKDTSFIEYPIEIGHYPFDYSASRKLLNLKTPNLNNQLKYKKGHTYRPCNAIWTGPEKELNVRSTEKKAGKFGVKNSHISLKDLVEAFRSQPA